MSNVRAGACAGLLAAGLVSLTAAAPAFAAPPAKPAISKEASTALLRMGESLLAKQFSFQAQTLRVYRDTDGGFLHIGHTLKVLVRRPDRMRVIVDGDDGVSELFYDGKTLVIYGPAKKEYVSIPVPGTIAGMLATAMGRMGVDFPLADFLTDAPNKAILTGVTSGKVVSTVTIDGTPSRHMTFAQPGLEMELWLTKNEQSLPERLFITYRSIPGQPSFIALFSDWNFSPNPTDADFAFKPPAGVKQVALKPANPGAQRAGAKP